MALYDPNTAGDGNIQIDYPPIVYNPPVYGLPGISTPKPGIQAVAGVGSVTSLSQPFFSTPSEKSLKEWLMVIFAILVVVGAFEFSGKVGSLFLITVVLGMLYVASKRGLL